ncbi:12268_t:CDS:1, partial [Ambispora gerdemannii]
MSLIKRRVVESKKDKTIDEDDEKESEAEDVWNDNKNEWYEKEGDINLRDIVQLDLKD